MGMRVLCGGLIIIALMIVPAALNPLSAASNEPAVSSSKSMAANSNPHKHRYWRHRGGTHPHYGSRRVRT